MAFRFPFSNLHELNLDWILGEVKHFAELIPDMEAADENVQQALSDSATALETANTANETADDAKEIAEDAKEIAEQAAQAIIPDGAVTTIKIADDAVTTAKIADGNVTTAKIADENVTTAKIADDAVTTAKIADGAVTPAKLSSLIPIANGGTNADNALTACENLLSKPWIDFSFYNAMSKQVYMSNGTRVLIVIVGSNANQFDLIIGRMNSSGTFVYKSLFNASEITLTLTTNNIEFSCSAGSPSASILAFNNYNDITLTDVPVTP